MTAQRSLRYRWRIGRALLSKPGVLIRKTEWCAVHAQIWERDGDPESWTNQMCPTGRLFVMARRGYMNTTTLDDSDLSDEEPECRAIPVSVIRR